MKKTLALVCALCLVFALCACGQTAAPAEKTFTAEVKDKDGNDLKKPVSAYDIDRNFSKLVDMYMEDAVALNAIENVTVEKSHYKVSNRMERIMAEFEAAYPFALEQLATAYPDLNETERQIAVLNFLHFRGKEEAELLGFAENTIMKYRSNLNKKAGSDPISALLA